MSMSWDELRADYGPARSLTYAELVMFEALIANAARGLRIQALQDLTAELVDEITEVLVQAAEEAP